MNRSTKRSFILVWLSTSTAVFLTSAPLLAQDATVGVGATTTIPPRGARTTTTDPGEGRPAAAAAAGSSAHEAVIGPSDCISLSPKRPIRSKAIGFAGRRRRGHHLPDLPIQSPGSFIDGGACWQRPGFS